MRRVLGRYGPPVLTILLLYALNRLFLVPYTTGMLHRLLAWHFADFLAGGLMLCLLNAALEPSHRPPVRRVLPALGFSLLCGAFWEGVTPLYLPRSVGDWRDVLAVCLGGLAMLGWFHFRNPNKN